MVYLFAVKGKRRLIWFSEVADSEYEAIKQFRSVAKDLEIFAGPLKERCQVRNCMYWADIKIGTPQPWLAVCILHKSPFPRYLKGDCK